jgi:hypothetical protein
MGASVAYMGTSAIVTLRRFLLPVDLQQPRDMLEPEDKAAGMVHFFLNS